MFIKAPKMYKFSLSWILIFVVFNVFAQSDINYSHKKINKEIEKHWGIVNPELMEIEVPDSIAGNNFIQGKFFSVLSSDYVSHNYYIYIGRVNSCRAGGCSISMDPAENYESEYFDYFILFDSSHKVELVRIFNYAATHGQEVSAKGWLKQFSGYDGSDTLEVGKDVDAISGATISAYGITLDVQIKTELISRLIKANLKFTKSG